MNYVSHPREGGDPSCKCFLDSRLRGNDGVAFPFAGRRTLDVVLTFCILHFAFSIALGQQLTPSEVPDAISARTISPRFETLDLRHGLSQGSIFQILQDSHGFIWLGTQDGLNRYDGQTFKVYRSQPFDTTTINEGWQWDIVEDRDGYIWVATWGGGLNRFDPVTETFTRYLHDEEDPASIPTDRVRSLLATDDGTLWVGTTDGLSRMRLDAPGIFETFVRDSTDASSLPDDDVHAIFQDASGTLWLGLHDGLAELADPEAMSFKAHLTGSEVEEEARNRDGDHEVWRAFERPEEPGVLWIGTAFGMVRFDTDTGDWTRYVVDPTAQFQNWVYSVSQDPLNPGVLWVPSVGLGLSRFDIRSKSFVSYRNDPENPNSLPDNAVGAVLTDRSGIVWVGTNGKGITRFNPGAVGFEHIRSTPGNPRSLPSPFVWAIHESRDGTLWVGTSGGDGNALSAIDRATGRYRHYRHDPKNTNSIPRRHVSAIVEDRNGLIWIASAELASVDPATGSVHRYDMDPDARGPFPRALMVDELGSIWIGTENGVYRMDPRRTNEFYAFFRDPEGFGRGEHSVQFVMEDLAGFIWLGTANSGVIRLDPQSGKTTQWVHDPSDRGSLTNNTVTSIAERQREPGVLWITTAAGLNRMDTKSGIIRHFSERDGLPNNFVYAALEDAQGRLWMSTNQGISRFDPETETFRNYGLEIGLQDLEFNSGAFHRSSTGELFFGGVNGLNAFYPNELSENLNAPTVALVDLKLFNKSIRETHAVTLDKPLTETEELRLDYRQSDLTFDFVALHYVDPDKNEFAYMLEGHDEDWVHIGRQRSATFTNLEPGEYTFRVKAANSDGVWNEEGTSIHIVIDPPFWQTWWFRILAVFGVAGVLAGGFRLRVRQIEARNKALEAEVDNRTVQLRESNEQLEQSATIVEAINQETSFRRLLTKILEEARIIPGVEKATALVFMPAEGVFRVRASSGWEVDAMQEIHLTPDQARLRYVEQADQVAEDIFVAKDVENRSGAEQLADFGHVASFLVLRVRVEDDVVAYLVFDNLSDKDAFDRRDAELLERLREHIRSAFIKTRILEDLQVTLTDLRSTQDRLIQSEKLASLGQLTAGIAHEIKNPLNFVNNFAEMSTELTDELEGEIAKRKADLPEDLVDDLQGILDGLRINAKKIAEHGRRADSIVQNMLAHSNSGEGEKHASDLNGLLDEYVNIAYLGWKSRGNNLEIAIEREFDARVGRVDLVPQEMGRVFVNLLTNAFDALKYYGATHGSPKVTVSSVRTPRSVEVKITDNGPGIPEKVKAKIFEPFFTTKPTGSGTGLGLSMSYDIVTKGHGGAIEVESEEGSGATFIVRLPG